MHRTKAISILRSTGEHQLHTDSDFQVDRAVSRIALPSRVAEALREAQDLDEDPQSPLQPQPVPPPAPSRTTLPVLPRRRGSLALFDGAQAQAALEAVKAGRAAVERVSLQKQLLGRLIELGPWRGVARPARRWRDELAALAGKHPNAQAVIDAVHAHWALAERAGRPLRLPPLLMVGPPGVGKTTLAAALCRMARTRMHVVHVETSCHASALVGTELHWASAGTGALYDALVEAPFINPVVLLDELEKVPQRSDYPTVHKALLALLEGHSAADFRDAAVPGVALDASHVSWLATANSLDGIPAPLISRLQVVEVGALDAVQSAKVLAGIDADIRREFRLQDLPTLPEDVSRQLIRASPRRIRLLLIKFYGDLVRNGISGGQVSLDATIDHATALDGSLRPAADDLKTKDTKALSSVDLLTLTTIAALRALDIRAYISQQSQDLTHLRTDVIH